MSLHQRKRVHEDTLDFIRLSNTAYLEKWPLEDRFALVASRLQAEPMGFCLLKSNIEYPILQMGRWYDDVLINVQFDQQLYPYRLPTAYSDMILLDDISKINTGRTRYAIFRVENKCGWWRLPFDHKNYTWDLELRPI